MHNCINNTGGNLSHLEQMVNNFLPYSKQQLGFDQPVKIVFQSDPSNADVLLGKTAHYNPEQYEVYLYTDKRHPKDIMRSLSHELVHHAQNCRGDFGSSDDTSPGYAQRDPHLRKMEREAYTKGNLIFRDFEDLIKRGKITIDVNFKDSGEPQMSLKEWKDNELNTLLLKKWGLLKEEKGHEGSCEEAHPGEDHPVAETMYRDDECVDWDAEKKTCLDAVNPESSDMTGDQYGMEAKMGLKKEATSGKISVKEAKQITRRIIERIRKEGK